MITRLTNNSTLSKEIKIFYDFLLKTGEMQASYVETATATICHATRLAIDSNRKCYAFNQEPKFDGRFWQPKNKHKVFVFSLPDKVPFVAAESQFKFRNSNKPSKGFHV